MSSARATVSPHYRLAYHGQGCGGYMHPFATIEGAIAYARDRYALGFKVESVGGPLGLCIVACGIRQTACHAFSIVHPKPHSACPPRFVFGSARASDAIILASMLEGRGFVALVDYRGGFFEVSSDAPVAVIAEYNPGAPVVRGDA